MRLEELAGERLLSGVDFDTEPKSNEWDSDSNAILFRLDGVTYRVAEDPSDGYRSSAKDMQIVETPIKNAFEPVRVLVTHSTSRGDSESCDTIECLDLVTGKVVLEVGTRNTCDYYPWYVANFTPEHMSINAGK